MKVVGSDQAKHQPGGDQTVVVSGGVVLSGWESHIALSVNTVIQQPRTHGSNFGGKMSVKVVANKERNKITGNSTLEDLIVSDILL